VDSVAPILLGVFLALGAIAAVLAGVRWIAASAAGLWDFGHDLRRRFGCVVGSIGCGVGLLFTASVVWILAGTLTSMGGVGISPSVGMATVVPALVIRGIGASGRRARERREQEQERAASRVQRTSGLRRHLSLLLEAQDHCCGICGKPLPDPPTGSLVHVGHIVPVSRGGTNDTSHLQATHAECNLRKGVGP